MSLMSVLVMDTGSHDSHTNKRFRNALTGKTKAFLLSFFFFLNCHLKGPIPNIGHNKGVYWHEIK